MKPDEQSLLAESIVAVKRALNATMLLKLRGLHGVWGKEEIFKLKAAESYH